MVEDCEMYFNRKLYFENYPVSDLRAFSTAESISGIKQDVIYNGMWRKYAIHVTL